MPGEKAREARLRLSGHVRRKDDGFIGRMMLRMELKGKENRGRPEMSYMYAVKEGMAVVEVTEEDAEYKNGLKSSGAMQWSITIYVTQKRISWYGHALRRDDKNVSMEVTTMKVGGKRPR